MTGMEAHAPALRGEKRSDEAPQGRDHASEAGPGPGGRSQTHPAPVQR